MQKKIDLSIDLREEKVYHKNQIHKNPVGQHVCVVFKFWAYRVEGFVLRLATFLFFYVKIFVKEMLL